MKARIKFIIYKLAAYALMGLALYFFVGTFFMYDDISGLPVTAFEFKMGMTQIIRKGVAGLVIGFVGFLFNYSANLHKKDIDYL